MTETPPSHQDDPSQPSDRNRRSILRPTRSQWLLVLILVAAAVFGLFYQGWPIEGASLFIGLPTILSVALALSPKTKTPVGAAIKGMTIFMLMSVVFLGAGGICVLMAAPLFYATAIAVAAAIKADRNRNASRPLCTGVAVSLLALMSLEGATQVTSLNRIEQATISKIVHASAQAVERRLAETPRFEADPPLFFKLGFPRPISASGSGLQVGDRRSVFLEDATFYAQDERRIDGEVVFEIVARGPGRVRFELLRDESHVARWLGWRSSEVSWQALDEDRTVVTWTLAFERRLDPWWYFGPLQRYAVGLAAESLVDNLAAPNG